MSMTPSPRSVMARSSTPRTPSVLCRARRCVAPHQVRGGTRSAVHERAMSRLSRGRRALLDGAGRVAGRALPDDRRRLQDDQRDVVLPADDPTGTWRASLPVGRASNTTSSPTGTGCSSSTMSTTRRPTSPGLRPLDQRRRLAAGAPIGTGRTLPRDRHLRVVCRAFAPRRRSPRRCGSCPRSPVADRVRVASALAVGRRTHDDRSLPRTPNRTPPRCSSWREFRHAAGVLRCRSDHRCAAPRQAAAGPRRLRSRGIRREPGVGHRCGWCRDPGVCRAAFRCRSGTAPPRGCSPAMGPTIANDPTSVARLQPA